MPPIYVLYFILVFKTYIYFIHEIDQWVLSSYVDSIEKRNSDWVYVGNLSFDTTESQIDEIFSRVGKITNRVMGLNKYTLEPCGFCFIKYHAHYEALDAVALLHNMEVDERVITVKLDAGYRTNRRYGRGETGGQVRDDRRTEYDAQRGGEPKVYLGLPEIKDKPQGAIYIKNPRVLKKHRELREKGVIP